jgi:pimeloyl-ACP methyl ester carboxylesterase
MRFVLVHGGNHGAWCWDLLRPELERRGHATVAVDLPGHGGRATQAATLEGYRDAVVEQVEPGDILVGHSMGGYVISVAADVVAPRVQHLVYLAAGLPVEGKSMTEASGGVDPGSAESGGQLEIMGERGTIDSIIEMVDNGTAFAFRDPEEAKRFFYHDCPPKLADWAVGRLTPQPLAPVTVPISIRRFWSAELPRSFVKCAQDKALAPDAADAFVRRLGVDPFVIDTSHSPFLSRPSELAELLVEAVGRSPVARLSPW